MTHTDDEQVRFIKIKKALVANRVMDAHNANEYAGTCIERARAYDTKLLSMPVAAYLKEWAKEMTAQHETPFTKCHHNYLPWLAALMVVRYGEAVDQWEPLREADPDHDQADIDRALRWQAGNVPDAVTGKTF